jgi:hypothetical protein
MLRGKRKFTPIPISCAINAACKESGSNALRILELGTL